MIYLLRMEGKDRQEEELMYLKKALISHALKRDFGLTGADLGYKHSGAPYLLYHPGLHLSITHAPGLMGCVISHYPVGLDAERIRKRDEFIAKKILSATEYSRYQSAMDPDWVLFSYFTLKEAYGKALGTGLSYDFRKTDFNVAPDSVIVQLEDTYFYCTSICEGFVISVCYLGKNPTRKDRCTELIYVLEEG